MVSGQQEVTELAGVQPKSVFKMKFKQALCKLCSPFTSGKWWWQKTGQEQADITKNWESLKQKLGITNARIESQ